MAVESYGRTDDGIAWEVRHRLWSGPWWWVLTMPDGQVRQSPECYETEKQARDAVEDARRQALAGLPPVETMASLRARAEAAEARVAQAEADALLMVAERCMQTDDNIFAKRLSPADLVALSNAIRPLINAPMTQWDAAVRRILAAAGGT